MTTATLTRVFENRVTYATLLLLFALGICLCLSAGGAVPSFGAGPSPIPGLGSISELDSPFAPNEPSALPATEASQGDLKFAIGPIPPPNPWDDDNRLDLAIGPIPPPNPWDDDNRLNLAIGPIPPPNPWDDDNRLNLAIGPIPPPNPWDDDNRLNLAIGPIPPPNPWDDDNRNRSQQV